MNEEGRVVWDGQVGAWFVEGRGDRIGPCPVDEGDEEVTPSVLELLSRTVSDLRNTERLALSHRASLEKCQAQALARVRALTAALLEALEGWESWSETRPGGAAHRERIAELRRLTRRPAVSGKDEP